MTDGAADASAATGSAASFPIGERVQAVRKARGLSQRELARRAGITNGSLSLIEQGRVSPSLASLEKILLAVPMSLQEFFADASPVPVVREAREWTELREGPVRARLMRLAPIGEGACYLMDCEMEGSSEQGARPLLGTSHFAAGVLLQGSLEVHLNGVRYRLEPGDGFQSTEQRDQRFVNPANEVCHFVMFVRTS